MKSVLLSLSFMACLITGRTQTIVGDATLPNSIKAGSQPLVINGAGMREKMFLDIYAAGLYLTAKSSSADEIINVDKPMAIRLQIVSTLIDSEKMIEAVNEGFTKSTGGKTEPLKAEIGQFINIFKKEPIKLGDIYDIIYSPENGVQVLKGGKVQDTIKGLPFKKALFGIWLGAQPADEDLKNGLLGK